VFGRVSFAGKLISNSVVNQNFVSKMLVVTRRLTDLTCNKLGPDAPLCVDLRLKRIRLGKGVEVGGVAIAALTWLG